MTPFNRVSKTCAAAVLSSLLGACAASTQPADPNGVDIDITNIETTPVIPGYQSLAFPTGDKETSTLLIERNARRHAALNVPYPYEIKVTNLTNVPLADIVLTGTLDPNFKVAKVDPAAATFAANKYVWTIPTLAPKETKTLTITGVATKAVLIQDAFVVTFTTRLAGEVYIVEPRLTLATHAPDTALASDPVPVTFTVTNSGNGLAQNVNLHVTLTNLTGPQAEKSLSIPIGDLGAGDSKSVTSFLKGSALGAASAKATATGDGNLKSDGVISTKVVSPDLAISKIGVETSPLGRELTYKITVTNKGDGEARNVIIQDAIPTGATFAGASDNGILSPAKDTVTWNIGGLLPAASREVSISLTPTRALKLDSSVIARAHGIPSISAVATTSIKGVPNLLLEVIDQKDPVAVGDNAAYSITVTNQGTGSDTGIKTTITLDPGMEFIKADGVTSGSLAGNTITFQPLKSLPPKDKAAWRVIVKAKTPGTLKLNAAITSDQSPQATTRTESTTFYK